MNPGLERDLLIQRAEYSFWDGGSPDRLMVIDRR